MFDVKQLKLRAGSQAMTIESADGEIIAEIQTGVNRDLPVNSQLYYNVFEMGNHEATFENVTNAKIYLHAKYILGVS